MLAAAYLALGYVAGVDFRHVIQPGAAHSEVYWAQRSRARCSSCSELAEGKAPPAPMKK